MKITLIRLVNFFQTQGSTEPYYVYHYLRQRFNVFLITSLDRDRKVSNENVYCIPIKKFFLPKRLYFDLKALVLCLKPPFKDSDLFYTYRGVLFTPIVMKIFFKRYWVCDFREDPIGQEREFSKIFGTLTWSKRAYLKGMKWLYCWALKRCDLIITLSDSLKEIFIHEYGVDSEKIYIQPLGVDIKLFCSHKKPRFDIRPQKLVYVTSLGVQRGIQTIFKALRLLKDRGLIFQLILVGSGPKNVLAQLKKAAQEEGVTDRVAYKGFIPHQQIPALLETCDIALCPIPNIEAYRVASPTKVFEYLAMGKIVIASDIPSNRSIIQHRRNGFLIPPDDPFVLADAVAEIYCNKELRKTLIWNTRDSIRKYDWKVLLPKLEGKLKSVFEHR